MEFNLETWLEEISNKVKYEFDKRLLLIGIQGSFRRGDATETSDVDLVVILDELSIDDLKKYERIVKNMPFSKKACGFFGGKEELLNWAKSELFQFVNDTKILYGSFDGLVPPIEKPDIEAAVKNGACTLYHAACHSFIHSEDKNMSLSELYKGTFFILQAIYYLQSGEYVSSKNELVQKLEGLNKEILELCINKANIPGFSEEKTEAAYKKLIKWSSLSLINI